jgi:hypothetical protein
MKHPHLLSNGELALLSGEIRVALEGARLCFLKRLVNQQHPIKGYAFRLNVKARPARLVFNYWHMTNTSLY